MGIFSTLFGGRGSSQGGVSSSTQLAPYPAPLPPFYGIKSPYTPDAAPAVSPIFSVDWRTSSAFPSQLALSRSSSATFFNENRLRATAASGGPRIEYNPLTGQPWGLLLEQQRTNLCFNSDDITAASYISGGTMNVAAATTKGADGAANMTTLTAAGTPSATAGHSRYSNVTTVTQGLNTAIAMDVKFTNWNYVYINIISNVLGHYATAIFDFSTAAITETSVGATSGTIVSTSVLPLANGIYRIGMVASINDPSTTNRYFQFGVAAFATGNTYAAADLGAPTGRVFANTENYLAQCVDIQVGDYQTSHIVTTSSAVTRSADILSTTNAGLLGATGWEIESGEVTLASGQVGTLIGVNTVTGLGVDATSHVTTEDGGTQTTANTGTWTGTNRAGLAWTP